MNKNNYRRIAVLLAVIGWVHTGYAQEELVPFNPLDAIQGQAVFVGMEEIGKTDGRYNYIQVSVRAYTVLESGATDYYVLLLTSSGVRGNIPDIIQKILTLDDARKCRDAILDLSSVDADAGVLPGSWVWYGVTDDLSVGKWFKVKTMGRKAEDRGRFTVGSVSAPLNMKDFLLAADLLGQAIQLIEERQAD